MKLCIINGSPKGNYSITLQTILYLQKRFPKHQFSIIHAGQRIKAYEKEMEKIKVDFLEEIGAADVLVFTYPVYTFLAPSQLHRFIELIKESGINLAGKFATQITTSKHFYDVTAHRYIEDNCHDLGMKVVHGLSADMEDLLTKQGQKDAEDFFRYLEFCVEKDVYEPIPGNGKDWEQTSAQESRQQDVQLTSLQENGRQDAQQTGLQENEQQDAPEKPRILAGQMSDNQSENKKQYDTVIVADLKQQDTALRQMIQEFTSTYPYPTRLVNIAEYPFTGGCLGCFSCAGDGKCIYKDGFDRFLREEIQTADAVVYAFTIKDHSMGARFKMYDDRQFCNGHRTVTEGMPFGYIVNGDYENEPNLRTVIEARCEVGHNFLGGVGYNGETLSKTAERLAYAVREHYIQPRNFYGVGGMKIFRDLIWVMRGLMKADHDFYKKHGVYDFPQKRRGYMIKMSILGSLIRNPKIKAKMGNKMNEGMLAPYKKVMSTVE